MSRLTQRDSSNKDMLRILVIFAAVLVVMVVLTIAFGATRPGPSLELIADPAAGLPF
jgi:hypothetical protein